VATKEDILEQIVEEDQVHKGYFVKHNLAAISTEVSSMKASLSRCLAMKGWRLPIQMRRRSATSWRFCSSACRSFLA
jgi:hypothetical protein